jgi:2-polyprenyl-3-methyl-5-hydroxy-6-metoxy-1,4-benzoquinol methylase
MLEKELTLFQRSKETIWTDGYIGKSLLKAHLDESNNGASRKAELRIKTINWIHNNIKPNASILDLGCGPGLYSYELGKLGHKVLGIDFNKESINYAKENKTIENMVEYQYGNYLEDKINGTYDAIIMIWCDFGALIPKEQELLLEKIKGLLKDDGVFIFDVFNELTNNPNEGKTWNIFDGDDFWNKEPYILLEETKHFDTAVGRKYILIDKNNGKIKKFILWDQYYNENSINKLLENSGFKIEGINEKLLEGMEEEILVIKCCKAAKNCT